MKENIVREKSYNFALSIVETYKYIVSTKKEYVMSKQVLRSGTSIGANIEEAQYAQSKKDFISKLSISLKEASETKYWLRLLKDSRILEQEKARCLLEDCTEIITLLTAIIKKCKDKE